MKNTLIISFLLLSTIALGQSVTISPSGSSALVDIKSTSSGLLPPRMTTTSRLAIASPVDGLMVFDTDTDSFWYFNSGRWRQMANQANSIYQQPTDRYVTTGSTGDNFGSTVDLGGPSGSFALIGAPRENANKGEVYLARYQLNNIWTLSAISHAGISAGDQYGRSLALSRAGGPTLNYIVGAPLDDSTNANSGSAYVYEGSGSNRLRAKLFGGNAAGNASGAFFGRSVDIVAESTLTNTGLGYAVVGATGINSGRGGVYVYKFNPNTLQWDLNANLVDATGAIGDSLGLSVSLYYDTKSDDAWIFAGAPYDDVSGFTNAGSIMVYRKPPGSSVWSVAAKVTMPSPSSDSFFGYAIDNCFECDKVMVGAPSTLGNSYDLTLSSISGSSANFTVTLIPDTRNSGGSGGLLGLGSTLSAMKASNCSNIFLLLGANNGVLGTSSSNNFGYARLLKYNGTSWETSVSHITDPNTNNQGFGYGRAVSLHTGSKNILIGAPFEPINGNDGQGKVQFVKFEN